jgi:hypothetical protein
VRAGIAALPETDREVLICGGAVVNRSRAPVDSMKEFDRVPHRHDDDMFAIVASQRVRDSRSLNPGPVCEAMDVLV